MCREPLRTTLDEHDARPGNPDRFGNLLLG